MGEHLADGARGADTARDRLTSRQQRVLEAVPVARPARRDSIARTAGLGVVEVRPPSTSLRAARPGRADPDGLAARRRRGEE